MMAVADIAAQPSPNGVNTPVSLTDIAERQNISLTYLEQIFSQLRKAGLVDSTRGPGGGYNLAAPAAQITLDRIIFAVNEDIRAHGCTPEAKIGCTGHTAKCLTHSLWGALESHIEHFLASITVQDVLDNSFSLPSDLEAAQ